MSWPPLPVRHAYEQRSPIRMSASVKSTSQYMILFRSKGWEQDLSPEEMQTIMSQTMAWFERLHQEGKMKAAQPLFEEGKVVSGKKGRTVSDGPFAESKEAIAGYLLLEADSLEQAIAIAQQWPLLECGGSAEVRPVAPECPAYRRVLDQQMAEIA
jgi:hypothetical protein